MNKFLGQKIAIVSPRPQTTRTRIVGVLTKNEIQLVFTDTPGFHRPRTKLGNKMVKAVGDSILGVDACLLVTEPLGEIRAREKELIEKVSKANIPIVLAINKIDTIIDKTKLILRIEEFSKLADFEAIVPVSAIKGDGLITLLDQLSLLAFPSEHFFPADTLTDQPERVIASEMIREKLLRLLDKEIPHGIAVSIEIFKEREDKRILDVEAIIYCEKDSHKGIIIGKNGAMLKKVSTRARQDMENFFDCKVNLQCWVKVKEDWRNRDGLIHNFGLD